MKFEIPPIYEEIKLAEYAQEFGEIVIQVRVNPSRLLLKEFDECIQENVYPPSILSALVQLWKDWTADDVEILIQHSLDTDPALVTWLILKTFQLIRDHRLSIKKNWITEFSKQPELGELQ